MFNKGQLEAINDSSSHILCLAGAGTGKTTVLVERIKTLLQQGKQPDNMLCLTFTKVAGNEMKQRLGEQGASIFINTFHSFCLSIIQNNLAIFGLKDNFTIIDNTERLSIIEQIIQELKIKENISKEYIVQYILGNNANDGQQIKKEKITAKIANYYLYSLKNSNCIDIDLLIGQSITALRANPDLLKYCQDKYKYVFVDEFQDTNDQQIEFLRLLNPANLFLVGDDYQAIYGFNDSKVEYILEVAKNPEYKIIRLEENYRCTKPIIQAANNVITYNQSRTIKNLFAHKDGPAILKTEYNSFDDEIEGVVNIINKKQLKNCCIITRLNSQIKKIIPILKKNGIFYKVLGKNTSILDYKEIQDIINVLELVQDPLNDTKMEKFLRTYADNIAEEIIANSIENECSYYESAIDMHEDNEAISFIEECDVQDFKNYSIIDCLYNIQSMNFIKNISKDAIPKLIDFIKLWKHYYISIDNYKGDSLQSFIIWYKFRDPEEVNAILNGTNELGDNIVSISTAHSTKGLEFDNVFIVGLNEDIFPHKRGDIEEERRLFFVAVTRAKNFLSLSWSKNTVIEWNKKIRQLTISRFIHETESEYSVK